ncbi:ArsR/SmtB family transcription factor [Salinispora arenicola]|uniref:ArsR/SmtB family transcription factor n=2 Tax=Salinispora arenicola TaxID=168697 RepID=UPI0027DC336A|nr:ArsR family transcriptional regulator [Salinispora arenicola]
MVVHLFLLAGRYPGSPTCTARSKSAMVGHFANSRYDGGMATVDVLKTLASEPRLHILQWMKQPSRHFTQQDGIDMVATGVCVKQVADKLGMTQSTASQYLAMLLQADLLIAERIGKYTYYRRNEAAIARFVEAMNREL